MILKSYRYFSAYDAYCQANVEVAYINMKLIIVNRESGTGNWLLVPYLSKRVGYFQTVDREQIIGNRELVPCSLFWYKISMFLKCKSGTRNQFPVPFEHK